MNKILVWIGLVSLIVFASCKRQNISIFGPGSSAVENFLVQEIDFDYFSSKAKVSYDDGTNKLNFTANIRMKKDSVIWISATGPMSVEAVRAMITKDSVFVMNRLDNTYTAYSTDFFLDKFNVDLSLNNLQNIILGNLLIPKRRGDKLLKDKNKVWLILEQEQSPMVVQNFVATETMKVNRISVEEKRSGATISVDYADFKPLDTLLFARKNNIKAEIPAGDSKKEISIGINYNKLEIGKKPVSFPFNVPGKYDTQSR